MRFREVVGCDKLRWTHKSAVVSAVVEPELLSDWFRFRFLSFREIPGYAKVRKTSKKCAKKSNYFLLAEFSVLDYD